MLLMRAGFEIIFFLFLFQFALKTRLDFDLFFFWAESLCMTWYKNFISPWWNPHFSSIHIFLIWMHISMRVYGWTPFYSSYWRLCWSNIVDGIKQLFQDTGKSCIVRHTNNCSTLNFHTKFSLNFTYVYMYK